uniref:Uncharacterized protein LOC102801560 n=1 Tax=Saccoglossus kowalevskii TaxID=10224 RepID=A0ABM0ME45_SACKO|nr:PREDICTED: uncharacterized protein LOC102801560 [Saccoglossus kowalevskii]
MSGSLMLIFLEFNLQNGSPECNNDYVQFVDGVSNQTSSRFCGTELPPPWVSDTGLVYVHFVSDSSVGGYGYILQFDSYYMEARSLLGEQRSPTDCNEILFEQSGLLSTPNYPGNYDNNLRCTITIHVGSGRIYLEFTAFEFEFVDECRYDNVQIIDNISRRTTPLLCGVLPLANWTSDSQDVSIVITTDSEQSRTGFAAVYETLPPLNDTMPCYGYSCDGGIRCLPSSVVCNMNKDCEDHSDEAGCTLNFCDVTLTHDTGFVTSPNYPDNYPASVDDCVTSIDIGYGRVELVFQTFDLENSENCVADYLAITDGISSQTLCGNYSLPDIWLSDSHNVYIRFRSDDQIGGNGFNLTYRRIDYDEPCFLCDNNTQCIPLTLQCNAFSDCVDMTDEENCPTSPTPFRLTSPQTTHFYVTPTSMPSNQTTISTNYSSECKSGEYRCDNGQCIHRYSRCNLLVECDDRSDETSSCRFNTYNTTHSVFDGAWYSNFLDVTDEHHIYQTFRDEYYRDNGFDRVKGEDPPDWLGFMTFSSSPDFSDIRSVLKLTPEEIYNYGHQLNDFILQCSFDQQPCNMSEDFTTFQDDKYGNCFEFNRAEPGRKTHDATRTGANFGLKLTLFMEQSEYISIYGRDAGARVVILPNDEPVFPYDEGINIKPGTVTSIGVREHNIERMPSPHGNCSDGNKDTLYGKDNRYTALACQKTCLLKNMGDRCGCTDDLYPVDVPECSVLNKTQDLCRQLVYYLYHKNKLSCDCAQPCCRNLASLEIYFDELNYELIEEQEAYPIENLCSDIGGTLGLYIGISAITVFEFMEFIGDVFVLLLARMRGKSRM